MKLKTGEEIQPLLAEITYADKQRHPHGFDLTVNEIYRLTSPGVLDFGGSEYQSAGLQKLEPRKRNPDDKYGWWELTAGDYMVRFNETMILPDGCLAMLLPHERLLHAGAIHSISLIHSSGDFLEVPIQVLSGGVQIKQNARISTMIVWSR